jgi:hypothetical protein
VANLVQDGDPFIDRRATGDHQHPDRFDVAVTMLRLAGRRLRERGPCRSDRIDIIGLAVTVTGLTVRSIHLHDSDALATQMTREAGAIGASALDPDPLDRPEPSQPADELGVTGTSGRERFDAEDTAIRVDGGSDVEVEVGVDPTGDLGLILYDGHCHPFR